VIALLAGISQVPGLVSTERIRASQSELVAGDLDRARELADQAIEAEPWAGAPYAARAEALESAGDLRGARDDVDAAIDRDPYNWREYLLRARIDAKRGDRRRVRSDLSEVRRLAPRSPYLLPTSPFRRQLDGLLSGSAFSSKTAFSSPG
jgi:tetratricopeptide (TPR) repeat protein